MNLVTRLLIFPALIACRGLASCGNSTPSGNGLEEEVILPDAFKNTNFGVAAGNWNESGAALFFDDKLSPTIQTGSSHNEFYDIGFEPLPLKKKEASSKTMYFLPFKVTDQVIDDGYFKNGTEYKFWLSYEDKTYFCGVSQNNDALAEPEKVLTEGVM